MNDTSTAPPDASENEEVNIEEQLATVYHDLNNPLSIISGNAQFLLELCREADLDEQFVRSVEDIQEAADRMGTSLQRLMQIRKDL
ncbi:histidine kinase dimerization/phospho-acceptor domain-containing protein [Salisaeta longa]|uniref:histidine kinase dimerization/phospho-acceptor domain-containing protein n=1 Tax=Salisaeta longa TaxID=503170 RepID=UPI0003B681A8|nr:histidine kinase dimerization/phospho-acceptor domain-containing protein [Salisaeta longa]